MAELPVDPERLAALRKRARNGPTLISKPYCDVMRTARHAERKRIDRIEKQMHKLFATRRKQLIRDPRNTHHCVRTLVNRAANRAIPHLTLNAARDIDTSETEVERVLYDLSLQLAAIPRVREMNSKEAFFIDLFENMFDAMDDPPREGKEAKDAADEESD
jgi:hypothetical protein